MLATLFMDIFPNISGAFLYTVCFKNTFSMFYNNQIFQLTGFSLQSYIGPYSTVSACIEMGICAYFYQKMFKKRFNPSRVFKGPNGFMPTTP